MLRATRRSHRLLLLFAIHLFGSGCGAGDETRARHGPLADASGDAPALPSDEDRRPDGAGAPDGEQPDPDGGGAGADARTDADAALGDAGDPRVNC